MWEDSYVKTVWHEFSSDKKMFQEDASRRSKKSSHWCLFRTKFVLASDFEVVLMHEPAYDSPFLMTHLTDIFRARNSLAEKINHVGTFHRSSQGMKNLVDDFRGWARIISFCRYELFTITIASHETEHHSIFSGRFFTVQKLTDSCSFYLSRPASLLFDTNDWRGCKEIVSILLFQLWTLFLLFIV